MAGRSHNVAAQATTLGKRFATVADELLVALRRLDDLLARYPLRGIKGPVGTAQDMLDLLGGDAGAARRARAPGRRAPRLLQVLTSVGQVYPRSLDYDVLTRAGAARGRAVLARDDDPADGRARAGHRGLPARARSARRAMPHKMNTRSAERINGFAVLLRGYAVDGRRAGRRPVERGRRLLLGGPPGRAARRVLRRWTGCWRPR